MTGTCNRNQALLADRVLSILGCLTCPDPLDAHGIGVLHHSPNGEQTCKSLPLLRKPGGQIAVWLYSERNHWREMSDVDCRVRRRMSPSRFQPASVEDSTEQAGREVSQCAG